MLSLTKTFVLSQKFSTKIGYPGSIEAETIQEFKFQTGLEKSIPIFQIVNKDGEIVNEEYMEKVEKILDKSRLLKMYHSMVQIRLIDDIFVTAQRQGRISSYMKNTGEEAIQIGVAEAMDKNDIAYMQYREHGLVMHRGFSVQEMLDQCLATTEDVLKGRRMPIHYGKKEINCVPVSAPLGTQIPQAAGHGYSLRMDKKPNVAVCFFGDGCASEGDFHSGLNFAAVRRSNTVFICRNNGWAISTPVKDQYRGDGIAARAIGYGIPYIRIDGFDIFSTFYAMHQARNRVIEPLNNEPHGPILIETMGYRLCNHTTSDDSLKYRTKEELNYWESEHDPMKRFKKYLIKKGFWSEEEEKDLVKPLRKQITTLLRETEKKPKVPVDWLIDDVFEEKTPRLIRQLNFSKSVFDKYPDEYPKN